MWNNCDCQVGVKHRETCTTKNLRNLGSSIGASTLDCFVISLLIHNCKSHRHIPPRNPHVIKSRKPIIHIVIPNFWTNVPRFYTRQKPVIVHASQRNQKIMYPPIHAPSINQPRNDHGMIGRLSQSPWPKLGTRQSGTLNDPLSAPSLSFKNVAVVSSARMLDPCPNSVWA